MVQQLSYESDARYVIRWHLTNPMDLESYGRWYDYSRARDEMFAATDTNYAPWNVVRSDDKRRARLNIITHLLAQVPYKEAPRNKVKLPKRDKDPDYQEPDYPLKIAANAMLGWMSFTPK